HTRFSRDWSSDVCSSDLIRHWEREGLFPAAGRSAAGYRRYGAEAIDRARFIRTCQRAGLRLGDIADLLAVRDTGVCPCEPAERQIGRASCRERGADQGWG